MYDHLERIALAWIPGFMIIDLVHQARAYQMPRRWRLNGLLVSTATMYLSFQVPGLRDALLGGGTLFDGAPLGPWAGAALGMVFGSFRNPQGHGPALDFRAGASSRWFGMFTGQGVSEPSRDEGPALRRPRNSILSNVNRAETVR